MINNRIIFDGFFVSAPPGWRDVSQSLGPGDHPFTLNNDRSQVGSLQFSPAINQSGPHPCPSPQDLLSLLQEFSVHRNLGEPFDCNTTEGSLSEARCCYHLDKENVFLKVWYISDGKSIALVTYNCYWGFQHHEIKDCDSIVSSIVFTYKTHKK
jgi:hypothetical protein